MQFPIPKLLHGSSSLEHYAMTNHLQRIRPRSLGFSLVELMVALAIGLIATIGIANLFSGTSRTNRLQEGLARLQENGRYAALRIEDDLRRNSGQFCSNSGGNRQVGAAAPMWRDRVPWIFAPSLNLPDSGGMRSVSSPAGIRSTALATEPYALSTRFFMQGYSCTTGTACTPALPVPGMFPAAALANDSRVPNSDILTIRYLRGTGWPIEDTDPSCFPGGTLTLAPQVGDDPVNLTAGSLALISDCESPFILPIGSVAGNDLTVGPRLAPTRLLNCGPSANRDKRVFNFSRDFVTITYYLAFRANDNPDARPNAGTARLTPSLVRRENGEEQVIVQGIDSLNFRYGVRDRAGNMRFLTAAQVDSQMANTIPCSPKPDGVNPSPGIPLITEPGCLWRSIRRVEASMLVNSGDEVPNLDPISRSFQYMGTTFTPTDSGTLPSGLTAGSFPRREFIAHATQRNKNP